MTDEVELFLLHAGVKGMKWGRTKAVGSVVAKGARSRYVTKPADTIEKNGGSKSKSAIKSVGKTVVTHMLIGTAGYAGKVILGGLNSGNPATLDKINKGINITAGILQTADGLNGTANTVAILASKPK